MAEFDNPPVSFVQNYGRNVQMMAQQMNSRLRDKVRVENPTGTRHYFELYNTNDAMRQVTDRFADIQNTDTKFERVAVDLLDFDDAKMVDNFDKLKMLIDPMSPIVQAQASQMGRQIDDIIIGNGSTTGVFGPRLSGQSGGTSNSFPAGKQIAVNSWAYGSGTGNSNLTISKILEAKALLDAAEVPEGDRFMAIDAINNAKLLATAEATSKDFVSQANLERGQIASFAGFTFVHTERLPTDGSGYRRLLAWHRTGIGLAIAQDAKADISIRKDKRSLPWQAYISLSMNASRLEDNKVIEIKCLAT
jgi:Phage capsid protein